MLNPKLLKVVAGTNKISANNTATGYGTLTVSADKDVTVNDYAKSTDNYSSTASSNSGNGYVAVKGYAVNGSKNTFSTDAVTSNAVTVTGYRLNTTNGNVASFSTGNAPLAAVTIPDNAGGDDLVYTIDTKHIDENQFKAMEKQFADNGFDLKIKAKVEDGKASKLSVNISGSREGSSSSASETFTTDNTDKKECFIRITASNKTGMVSITTSSPGDK